MMRWLISILMVFSCAIPLLGQMKVAHLDEEGRLVITETEDARTADHQRSQTVTIKEGFPLQFPAHEAFKNFRNVTLHDLDDDGSDEILFGILDRFYCYKGSTLLWSRPVSAIIRYPCAIGDLDNDGSDEIVVLTGYSNEPGVVYIYRADGSNFPNWPQDYGGFAKLSSPSLADLDGDQDLEILFGDLNGGVGALHAVHHNGDYIGSEWPVDLPNIPAVTPSIGDLDNDGTIEIVIASTRELFVLSAEGKVLPDWPLRIPETKFSFQSPVLIDLNGDQALEIVGTTHGDRPVYYAITAAGEHMDGWPRPIPDNSWSFHPPSVIQFQEKTIVINARPGDEKMRDVLYARDGLGELLPNYPIVQAGGHQGVSTIADIDGDQDPDLVVSSNLVTPDGEGFIWAYDLLSGQVLSGFPIMQQGWTFMNGVAIGDIDGDQGLDIVALSYTEHPGDRMDSTFIYAYDLGSPVHRIWWPTYKGSNLRDGFMPSEETTPVDHSHFPRFSISPNPGPGQFSIEPDPRCPLVVLSLSGEVVHRQEISHSLDLSTLPRGTYIVHFQQSNGSNLVRKVLIQ